MERQLWKTIVTILNDLDKPKYVPRQRYCVLMIVKVWFWAVIHDRPVSWACQRCNWPIWERRHRLPSNTTMSRRLRCHHTRQLIRELEKRVLVSRRKGNLVWIIDGKPLTISGCSKDRQAGYGRAAGGKAKGYKLHALVGSNGSVADWRVAPMNKDERVMARRMLKTTSVAGYVLADSNYDSNRLHQQCDDRGNLQLISARRYGPGRGLGHRKQAAGRLRSKDILEDPFPEFGIALLKQREEIERYYGNLSNWGGGLNYLPPWVRTYRRVHRWIQAKLIINAIKRLGRTRTCVV